jgi:hypothetical protein
LRRLCVLISCAWSCDQTRPFLRPCGSATVPFDVRGTRRTRGDPAVATAGWLPFLYHQCTFARKFLPRRERRRVRRRR